MARSPDKMPNTPERRPATAREAGSLQSLATNTVSGLVASLLTIAYCLSFSALLFQGPLKDGLAMGLWALLVGSAIAGLYVSLTTSLPPAEAGPDNPAVAVLSVLAATVSGSVLGAGGSTASAIDHVLVSFSIATLVTGITLFGLGALRLGPVVRFIPYPVIAGFLAASGWFLLTGGIEVVTGRDFSLLDLHRSLPSEAMPKLAIAGLFAILVYALKVWTGSTFVLPLAFLTGALVLDTALYVLGQDRLGSGWYISGTSEMRAWVPLQSLTSGGIDGRVFLTAAAEIGAVAGVTVIALLLDVTGLEVARTKTADLDGEFRSNGLANIIAAPLGGVMGNLSLNGSRLLDETGGLERVSGVIASLVVAAIVLTGLDLPGLVPVPILAGLLMYLGLVVLTEVLLRSPAHRAWTDFGLALLIMGAIVALGYLAGVMFGFVAACLTFAFSYSRIAVIRRHLTRVVYASNMDRSARAERQLQEEGDRIHIFWLSGFIFFGSSNGVFESIRTAIDRTPPGRTRYGVLDFADVSGFDTSALLSLVKLRNYADDNGVILSFAGLSPAIRNSLAHMKLIGEVSRHRAFDTRNAALEWSEDQVLAEAKSEQRSGTATDFEDWLTAELGGRDRARRIARYFERRNLTAGTQLYAQGAPSDCIDLVVDGTIAVMFRSEGGVNGEAASGQEAGMPRLVRRMSKRTVVGEMGFFRSRPRTASVVPEQGAVIYTLTRASYDRLMKEEPEVGAVFLEFIVRTVSDRLEFANAGIAALS
ncbi:MAG: SulP family inorganic anion transporter [Hyphomicrobium sp.]